VPLPGDPGLPAALSPLGWGTCRGYNTALFSGISARRGGLSTAIEAGVPEAILWMQSGHAQDVAARRYVQLGSPNLLFRVWEAFKL
jgi:hypothetical protein